VEQKVWYEWKPIFCQKCLQVGHACVDKQAAPTQIQKKSQGQGQRKEWIPTTSKAQGIQVEDNKQEKSDHEEDETTQEQGEWQTVRHRTSGRRDSMNNPDT